MIKDLKDLYMIKDLYDMWTDMLYLNKNKVLDGLKVLELKQNLYNSNKDIFVLGATSDNSQFIAIENKGFSVIGKLQNGFKIVNGCFI